MIAAIVLCSTLSCVAPVLYASDCSRWIAEYKQGLLQQRAARRLRAAKYRLTHLVTPEQPVHRVPSRRPMGPLESLRRFQIACGDLETPATAPKLPTPPFLPRPLAVEFPEQPMPTLPAAVPPEIAEEVPPLIGVPTTTTPVESTPVPSPVPEPGSLLLVATGVGAALLTRRKAGATA